MSSEKKIYVYADFLDHEKDLVGTIFVSEDRGRETYSFEYENNWVKTTALFLDPDLGLYAGRQYINDEKKIFGVFADSCPDRWGRMLMRRKEELRAKKAGEKPRKLLESDFLIGVYDEARMGGLRFKILPDGEFVSYEKEYSTPPWTSLRELEQAAISFETEENEPDGKWLKKLLAPGSSLGGARPKASVLAPDGTLWIAKFPSKHDDFDIGAWEMVVHELAELCDFDTPKAQIKKFSNLGSTYLSMRFDRCGEKRVHFSSAMTLLGKKDGADATDGSSYLEMVSFIKANGGAPQKDLKELWRRIVFGMAVSNTDDHFRNHGFILTRKGWRLSPMYDVNPDVYGEYLSLNVDEDNSQIDFEIALDASKFYGLSAKEAHDSIFEIKKIVSDNWHTIAAKYGISRNEIERMRPAFASTYTD